MSDLAGFESQITTAVEKLSESVVSIDSVRVARNFGYGFVPIEGKGSGVIIDPRGYVITNNHVIDGAARVQVHLEDGRSYVGEVVGADLQTDHRKQSRPTRRSHGLNGSRKRPWTTTARC